MDGRYKATDFLRALVESQSAPRESGETDGSYGFNDSLLLVLLDEMNLARIELYFSELLSRLELRRGDDLALQTIRLDIGAGVLPYELPLGDNVIFTGTMNEDETTQTLSDKVLDRGNIITFPRPLQLAGRKRSTLGDPSDYLRRSTWQQWIVVPEKVAEVLGEPIHLSLLQALNSINSALGLVNRAIGHRVFQAVEYYVANHPTVRWAGGNVEDEIWKEPFEDQIAQKVMPKLRGIETTSSIGRKCLDEIRIVLDSHATGLVKDFERARKAGEGAFLWNSADYLQKENRS